MARPVYRVVNRSGYWPHWPFGTWTFQHPRKCNVWNNTIPPDVDVLLTHGPSSFTSAPTDTAQWWVPRIYCELYHARPRLRLVVFGHVHESYGQDLLAFDAL